MAHLSSHARTQTRPNPRPARECRARPDHRHRGPPAGAATAASPPGSTRSFGVRATSIASDYKGTPYRPGGTTPRGFDCSGFTQFVYARLGTKVPRVSQAQYDRSHKVGKRVRAGDLIFFYRTGTRDIYHVGIYAGDDRIWPAARSGTRVRLERLWTNSWTGGRY